MDDLKKYIGDGVYASFDGFQLRLWTEREGGTHEIFFEPREWEALKRTMERWRETVKARREGVEPAV